MRSNLREPALHGGIRDRTRPRSDVGEDHTGQEVAREGAGVGPLPRHRPPARPDGDPQPARRGRDLRRRAPAVLAPLAVRHPEVAHRHRGIRGKPSVLGLSRGERDRIQVGDGGRDCNSSQRRRGPDPRARSCQLSASVTSAPVSSSALTRPRNGISAPGLNAANSRRNSQASDARQHAERRCVPTPCAPWSSAVHATSSRTSRRGVRLPPRPSRRGTPIRTRGRAGPRC